MSFNNSALIEIEKTVLSVLLHEPHLRNELIRRFPGKVLKIFPDSEAHQILRVAFGTDGVVLPSYILRENPSLLDTEWNPQSIFDQLSFEAGNSFWENVERLRQIAKQKELHNTLTTSVKRVVQADLIDIDKIARNIQETVSALAHDTSQSYDPSIKAAGEKYKKQKEDGKVGHRISTGILAIDTAFGGGVQKNPGELVIVSGFEKQRKTSFTNTLMINMLRNHDQGALAWVCNEGSVDRVHALGDLWAMEASRLAIVERVGTSHNGEFVPFSFSRYDVLTNDYSGSIGDIIDRAYEYITTLPIRMYFAGMDDGDSLEFQGVMAKVAADIEFNGVEQVIIDNFQGWRISGESDYDVMNRVVPPVDNLVSRYGILTIAISQYSRDGKLRGGGGAEGRASMVVGTEYNQQETPSILQLEYKYARSRPYFKVETNIVPACGLLYENPNQ